MIWIISAILLGLILGILGVYFSRVAYGLFFTVFIASILFLPSEFTHFNLHGHVMIKPEGFAHLGKKLAGLPEYIQWAGFLFVIFFFLARIITWFMTRLNIIPSIRLDDVDPMERTIEEYGYNPDEYSYH